MMLRTILLIALLALTGCQAQLVMYFVNALSDMLQRNGLKSLLSPTTDPALQVDENRVDGTGLNGNLLMSLKERFEKLNKTAFAEQQGNVERSSFAETADRVDYRPLSVERRTSAEDAAEISRRRFRLIRPLTPKNISEFGIPPAVENEGEMEGKPGEPLLRPVTPRIHLRPMEGSKESSQGAEAPDEAGRLTVASGIRRRPVSVQPLASQLQPGQPLIRPSPLPRPTPSLGGPVVLPTRDNIRRLPGGNKPIVIVPQAVGPPGQQIPPRFPPPGQPQIPRFQVPQNPNPLLGGGPPPPGFNPALSVPFDSRPRPDGSVPEDPRELLNRSPPPQQLNETEEEPPSNRGGVRFRIPPKPLGTGVPPPVPLNTQLPPNAQAGPVSSVNPSVQPRPLGPNRGPPFQVGVGQNPNVRIFNAPFGPNGPARVINGPNPNFQPNLRIPNGPQNGQQGPPVGGPLGNNQVDNQQPNDALQESGNRENANSANLQLPPNQQSENAQNQRSPGSNIPGFTPVGNQTDNENQEQPRPSPPNQRGPQGPQGARGPQGQAGPNGQRPPLGPNGQPLQRVQLPPNFVPRVGPNGVLLGPNGFPLRRRLPLNFQPRPNLNRVPLDGDVNNAVPQPSVEGGPVPGQQGPNPGQNQTPNRPQNPNGGQNVGPNGPVVLRRPVNGPPPNLNQQGPRQFGPNLPNRGSANQEPTVFPPIQNGPVAFGPPNGPVQFRGPPPGFEIVENNGVPPGERGPIPQNGRGIPQGFVPRGGVVNPVGTRPPASGPPGA